MEEMIVMSIFLFLCYLSIGFGIAMFLDTSYDINIPVGCAFFWPIIAMFVAILDVIKLIRSLIKTIRK